MPVQAILFDKTIWSPNSSATWLMRHSFHPIKRMHETSHYYRYRLMEPSKRRRYVTKTIGHGIKFIISF
jgi:hypothetical protein